MISRIEELDSQSKLKSSGFPGWGAGRTTVKDDKGGRRRTAKEPRPKGLTNRPGAILIDTYGSTGRNDGQTAKQHALRAA
jgi:hypothetical protein